MNSSDLCLSCGLCCDGTLIGHVQLANEELQAVKKVLEIEDENGNGFFLQPCQKYCNGCSIYEQRPRACVNFNCGLLKSFEAKDLSFNAASELIQEVKNQKIKIEHLLSKLQLEFQSQSFYFKMVELKKQFIKSDNTLTQGQQKLLEKLEIMNALVEKHFGVTLS